MDEPNASDVPQVWSRPAKLADTIAGHLERLILEGSLRPGERLLPERDLAKRFDVSRPSLREALERLEERGLLQKDANGAGHVADLLGEAFTITLQAEIRDCPATAYDYLEFRHVLEGQASYLASLRCTEVDRQGLRRSFERMLAAHQVCDSQVEWEAEAEFHLGIYEATHNSVLLHVMRNLFGMLRDDVFINRARLDPREGVRDLLLAQHTAIYNAVLAGDCEAARLASEAHIDFTRNALIQVPRIATERAAQTEAVIRPVNDPFARLLHDHADLAAFDYLEFRRMVAGEAAALAVQRATEGDLENILASLKAIEAAHLLEDPHQEAQADAEFHVAIYRGAHNAVMLHIMRRILGMLHQDVFYNRDDLYLRRGVRERFLRQHQAICEAILARDAKTATEVAQEHIRTTEEALREAQRSDARRLVAQRRRDGSGLTSHRAPHSYL